MGQVMTVDLSQAGTSLREFPNGVYEAIIQKAEADVAQSSGDPMIVIEFEIHHPELGNGTIRDYLPYKHPGKVKNFWQAINDMSAQELREAIANQAEVELDPDEFVGAHMLVSVGERTNDDKVYKTLVDPWYFPPSRGDLVVWEAE